MPSVRPRTFKQLKKGARRRIRSLYGSFKGRGAERGITRAFNIDRRTLYRIVSSPALPVAPRFGRPKLSYENQKLFAEIVEARGPIYLQDLPAVIMERFGIVVCPNTAHSYLIAQGLKSYSTQVGPSFAADQKPERVVCATEILRLMDSAIFIDEATIGRLHVRPPKYYGRGPGLFYETAFPRTLSSNVVGAVGFSGTLPLQLPLQKTVTGEGFARILESILKAVPRTWRVRYVVMDNAGIHNMEVTQNVLESYQVKRLHLTTYSPDMNIMEHLWATLKARLSRAYRSQAFTTIAEMDEQAFEIWEGIQTASVWEDFKRTLQAIIDSGGEYTGG